MAKKISHDDYVEYLLGKTICQAFVLTCCLEIIGMLILNLFLHQKQIWTAIIILSMELLLVVFVGMLFSRSVHGVVEYRNKKISARAVQYSIMGLSWLLFGIIMLAMVLNVLVVFEIWTGLLVKILGAGVIAQAVACISAFCGASFHEGIKGGIYNG